MIRGEGLPGGLIFLTLMLFIGLHLIRGALACQSTLVLSTAGRYVSQLAIRSAPGKPGSARQWLALFHIASPNGIDYLSNNLF